MNAQITKQELLNLDKVNIAHYEKFKTDNCWTVYDGIVDLDSYNHAKHRILWILKEVHEDSDDNPDLDDGDLRTFLKDGLREGVNFKKGWHGTFQPIVLTTCGILNNSLWNDLDYIKDDPNMIDIISNIAYINLKKRPGGAVANHNDISEFYLRDKEIILKQINTFNPNIIICGGTLNFLKNDLGLLEESSNISGHAKFYIQNEKIYIGAYHPANRSISQIEYCDDIIKAFRFWKDSN